MIYQVTYSDPSQKGEIKPDDSTGLELVDVDAVTESYVPTSGAEGELISFSEKVVRVSHGIPRFNN